MGIGSPRLLPGPTKNACYHGNNQSNIVNSDNIGRTISSSMSINLHGPNTGGFSVCEHMIMIVCVCVCVCVCISLSSGLVCPLGLLRGVPDITTDEARPW